MCGQGFVYIFIPSFHYKITSILYKGPLLSHGNRVPWTTPRMCRVFKKELPQRTWKACCLWPYSSFRQSWGFNVLVPIISGLHGWRGVCSLSSDASDSVKPVVPHHFGNPAMDATCNFKRPSCVCDVRHRVWQDTLSFSREHLFDRFVELNCILHNLRQTHKLYWGIWRNTNVLIIIV